MGPSHMSSPAESQAKASTSQHCIPPWYMAGVHLTRGSRWPRRLLVPVPEITTRCLCVQMGKLRTSDRPGTCLGLTPSQSQSGLLIPSSGPHCYASPGSQPKPGGAGTPTISLHPTRRPQTDVCPCPLPALGPQSQAPHPLRGLVSWQPCHVCCPQDTGTPRNLPSGLRSLLTLPFLKFL